MVNIEKLSDELSQLTILEASELVKSLEDKWGVKAGNIAMQQNNNTEIETKKNQKTSTVEALMDCCPK